VWFVSWGGLGHYTLGGGGGGERSDNLTPLFFWVRVCVIVVNKVLGFVFLGT